MNEKRTLRRRLAVDTLLSTSGSVAAILLLRGVSDPVPGFVVLLAWWTGCAALLSLAGLLLTGNSQVVMRYASLRGYSRLGRALLIKEAGMIILVLSGLLKLPSTTLAVVALLADLLFSAIALFAPRILVRSVRREEREIHAATGRRTALVAGIGRDSINLADESEASGRFTVLGYLSNDPADAGKVIGNRIVYAAATVEDIDALQWRLGGVDCILFPKGGDRDRPSETASGKAADDTNIPNNDAMTLLGPLQPADHRLFTAGAPLRPGREMGRRRPRHLFPGADGPRRQAFQHPEIPFDACRCRGGELPRPIFRG